MEMEKKAMKLRDFLPFFAALLLLSSSALAVSTPNSFHFQAVPAGTLLCNATTSSSYAQLASGPAANAPDIIIRNLGTNVAYFEIGAGGSGATAATVPSNGSGGSQAINPGEADLLSKAQADTVTCITSTSTTTLSITPGTGN